MADQARLGRFESECNSSYLDELAASSMLNDTSDTLSCRSAADSCLFLERYGMKVMLDTNFNEVPIFVNPKQYRRIMVRRAARRKQMLIKKPNDYMYESRHKHACTRKRDPRGRFLSKSATGPKKKTFSSYSAACILYGKPPYS